MVEVGVGNAWIMCERLEDGSHEISVVLGCKYKRLCVIGAGLDPHSTHKIYVEKMLMGDPNFISQCLELPFTGLYFNFN